MKYGLDFSRESLLVIGDMHVVSTKSESCTCQIAITGTWGPIWIWAHHGLT